MQEQFHQSQRLPKEKLESLMQRSDNPALLHFIILYSLFLGSCFWVVFSWDKSWLEIILSILSFGVLSCGLFACEPETVHNTAFKSKALNQWAARLAGIGHLYPSAIFRELHFNHHRYTHIPGKDPEISFGGKPVPSVVSSLPMYLSWLSGLPLLMMKVFFTIAGAFGTPEFLRKNAFPFISAKARGKVMLESWIVLAVYIGIVVLAIYVNPGFWGILIGQVVGHSLLASYVSAEHNGLPHEGDNILEKTRSMRTNAFVRWLMWNMPYHAEHHAYPAVPFHTLPQLHKEIEGELKHQDLGYPGFHLKVFSRKIK